MGRGWEIIDLPRGTKNPGRPGWQNERYDEETIRLRVSGAPRNLSVLLGEPSGGLVDVDLDCPEARVLAGRFLPPTGACFGRASSPRSHLLYVVDPVPAYERYVDPEAPDEDRATLVELRSGGQHTIFPPSTHPSGESIEWEQEGEPASLAGDEFAGRRRCSQGTGTRRENATTRAWHSRAGSCAAGLRKRKPQDSSRVWLGRLATRSGGRGQRMLLLPPTNWRRDNRWSVGPSSAS
jgi:hypothetical protein